MWVKIAYIIVIHVEHFLNGIVDCPPSVNSLAEALPQTDFGKAEKYSVAINRFLGDLKRLMMICDFRAL